MRMNRRPSYQPAERKEIIVSKAGKLVTKSMKPTERVSKIPITKQEKIDALIGEDPSVDTTTGRLPVEAAYVTMKRVISESGLKLNPQGLSVFNKLQSFPTDPALEVLHNQTWREFFSKKNERPNSASSSSSRHSGKSLRRPQSAGSVSMTREELVKKQEEMKVFLNDIFKKLVTRVEELWQSTKIPKADQKFYRQSLLKGPPHSLDQCKEISSYIYMLREHQATTLSVLRAIQFREDAVSKCYDVLAALQRKFSRMSSQLSRDNILPNSINNSHLSLQSLKAEADTNVFWKEELITALDDVRSSTLAVLRLIQQWRRNLWRPKPFVWCGLNYVLKMKDDLNVLESDMYVKLLDMVPLHYEDLLCVVFFPPDRMMLRSTSTSGNHTPARMQSPTPAARRARADGPSTATTTATAAATGPATSSINNNQQQQSVSSVPDGNMVGPNDRQHGGSGAEEYIHSLVQDFLQQINRAELNAAAAVVLEEETIQNAISIEQSALVAKGVFIPTLKLHPSITNVGSDGRAAASSTAAAAATTGGGSSSGLRASAGTGSSGTGPPTIKSRRSGGIGGGSSSSVQQMAMGSQQSLISNNSHYSADFSDLNAMSARKEPNPASATA